MAAFLVELESEADDARILTPRDAVEDVLNGASFLSYKVTNMETKEVTWVDMAVPASGT